jgi:ABC-type lipoprotein export system ATPase subunit
MSNLISMRNVSRDYVVDTRTIVTPVRNSSLDVQRGAFIMIIGRSGSGKTTFLNLAAGLIRPTAGEVYIDGANLWKLSDGEQSRLRNKAVGFVFQYPSLLASLTALENVVMPACLARRNGNTNPYDRAAKLLGRMGLSDRAHAYPKHLSSGEQRRVVIARALMNKPEILMADEPTSDLDVQTEREIMSMLRDINKSGVTILMVTHGLDLISYANRVLKMEDGELAPLKPDEVPGYRRSPERAIR